MRIVGAISRTEEEPEAAADADRKGRANDKSAGNGCVYTGPTMDTGLTSSSVFRHKKVYADPVGVLGMSRPHTTRPGGLQPADGRMLRDR